MKKASSSEDNNDRLAQLVYLTAHQCLNTSLSEATQIEKIGFLKAAGLSHEDIASILGTTVRVVTVQLSALRKAKTKKPNGKKPKR